MSNWEMSSVKKFLILLVSLAFINGCITIVFEPSMGGGQRLNSSESGEKGLKPHSGKDQKQ